MDNLLTWAAAILSLLNGGFLLYTGYKKFKPEVKKLEGEVELDSIEAAAKSQQLLTDRINELQGQLSAERQARILDLEQEREARKAELEAERQARKKESDYLRLRIKDAEREARDYRKWAAQLVKQIVQAGLIPSPFVPSTDESDPSIAPISGGSNIGDGTK